MRYRLHQSDIGVLIYYQILTSIKTRHTISYEVALTELQKNVFLWKAHEKPVLVNVSYVTFYKPHWIIACHIGLSTRILQQVSASTYFVPHIKTPNIKPTLLHFGLFLHQQQSRFLLSAALTAETQNCCALGTVYLTLHKEEWVKTAAVCGRNRYNIFVLNL